MIDRIVLDASAVIAATTNQPPRPDLIRRVTLARTFAPELLDLEVLHALRGRLRRGEVSADTAQQVVNGLGELPVIRVPQRTLIRRIWELRHSVTAYDAAYVALAEQLDVPLVTCDAKLAGGARAQGTHRAVPARLDQV